MTPHLRTLLATTVGMLLTAGAAAQALGSRIAGVRDGTIRLTYAARPGIVGNGREIRHRADNGDVVWRTACDSGPVRLTIDVQAGSVTDLRLAVGGRWKPRSGAIDLGAVPAAEAARYLLALAQHARGRLGGRAIFAATLADSVVVWPDLLRLARDRSAATETRRQAVFWVSQAAGKAATKGLDDLAGETDVDRQVREQAVFALSQRPADEGVPALIRIARTNGDPEIRRRAIFWLGQSNDPRALALFEDLLTGP